MKPNVGDVSNVGIIGYLKVLKYIYQSPPHQKSSLIIKLQEFESTAPGTGHINTEMTKM